MKITSKTIIISLILFSGCNSEINHHEPANLAELHMKINANNQGESNKMNTGNADVIYVKAIEGLDNKWTFEVTVTHPDTGWEDYVNGWDIMLEDGTVFKLDPNSTFTRLLLHPHVNEQPFTRNQDGIELPDNTEKVLVRAHDLIDGFGGKEVTVDLTLDLGDFFEVIR